jgi:hypothetical protein
MSEIVHQKHMCVKTVVALIGNGGDRRELNSSATLNTNKLLITNGRHRR